MTDQHQRPAGGDGDAITAAWREATTGREFQQQLLRRDLTLARSESGDCVVVGPHVGVHELNRSTLPGETAASIRAKLRDIDPERLPTVDYMRGLYADQGPQHRQPKREPFRAQRPPDHGHDRGH